MVKKSNPFVDRDILSITDFNPQSLALLFQKTDEMREGISKRFQATTLSGSVIALLFFEPSTRTYNSFSSAAQRLGAGIIGIQDVATTSMNKGESFEDTIQMMSGYADAIVIRHKEEGAARRAADVAAVPVINGGDGGNEHPTQMLLDLYTVHKHFGRLDSLTSVVGIDPLHSRVIRSFLLGLSQYKNNTVYLLSSEKVKLDRNLYNTLIIRGLKILEIDNEDDIPNDADIWYWNRVQKERFSDQKEYLNYSSLFAITPALLNRKGNKDMIIMDALPRVHEIAPEVDTDPRAHYFAQAKNGIYVRMALLASILDSTI